MSVCRAWYKAIIDTPQLWASIHIVIPPHLEGIEACVAFCETVVGRSGQLPLDIKLDYSRLPDFEAKYRAEFNKEMAASGIASSFRSWRWCFFHLDGFDHPLLHRLVPLVLKPLSVLIGRDGSVMSRWRSFNLIADKFWCTQGFGRCTLPRAIFATQNIGTSTSLLENLSIQYLGVHSNYDDMEWYGPAIWRTRLKTPFPNLPRVTTLSFSNIEMPISRMVFTPSRIEHLEVLCCDLESYRLALKCQNVTTLNIGLHNRVIYHQSVFNDITHLPFPRLRYLRLAHRPPNFFWKAIDAPCLEVLVFENFFATHNTLQWGLFPMVSRVEFRWPYMHNAYNSFLKPLLINLATKCPSFETLICTRSSGPTVQRMLKVVKGMGYEFKSLKTMITIFPKYDETTRESLDVAEWLA
ncbi:hypothetical protein CPB86DRAFT_801611 [Serendipita vermifera]|nr:hypothetical protein CPB86DRAFT_801611 [Serendipita vermifera]